MSHGDVCLQIFESFPTLIGPFKYFFKNFKKWQTFVSGFRDKPVKCSNSSGEGLDFFSILWRFHVQYCLDFVRICFNSPMGDHKSKEFP